MPRNTINGINRITWIGASIFALGAITLIIYVVGIRLTRMSDMDILSAMPLGLPLPVMAALVMFVGGVVAALGYWIDQRDQQRLREQRRSARSDKRNNG